MSLLRCCAFPIAGLACCFLLLTPWRAGAMALNVPADFPSIQAAIDAASNGDVVRVAPGTYTENLVIDNKSILLISHLYSTGDPAVVAQTIIDGGGDDFAIQIGPGAGPTTAVAGFTLQNAQDGIRPFAKFVLLDTRITDTSDGVDFEDGSGGFIRRSVFEGNSDDGLDLDDRVEVTIEDCVIRDNGNDGIEIRLHPFTGPMLSVVIRNNVIARNGLGGKPDGDGIQFIEYTPGSAREFRIEGNIIEGNAQAGIGMMCCQDTAEDLSGASLLEEILVFNNTFVGNDHGITGGDNTLVVNNIFLDHTHFALKRLDGNSIAAYNLFHNNGAIASASYVNYLTSIYANPWLDSTRHPTFGSPAVDFGIASYTWKSELMLDLQPSEYSGDRPDIGAIEQEGVPVPMLGAWGRALALLALAAGGGLARAR